MTYALPVIQPSSRIPEGRKPAWLKVRAPGGPNYMRLKSRLREWNLHSVCEEAHCPNIGECWEDATATFMILGDICTRNCGYCAIAHGTPVWEDREEPERIGRAVGELGLEYVVITSVNRDDLADGGAAHWAATVRAVGRHLRPSPQHLPVARYYHPDEFAGLAAVGRELGFVHVEAGPLVRSSYHAKRQADRAQRHEANSAMSDGAGSHRVSGHPPSAPASRTPLQ